MMTVYQAEIVSEMTDNDRDTKILARFEQVKRNIYRGNNEKHN